MSDLVQHLNKAKKKGLENGASGNPPPHAEHPDATELDFRIIAQKIFNIEKDKFTKFQSEISKKINLTKTKIGELENELVTLKQITNTKEIVKAKLDEKKSQQIQIIKDFLIKDAHLKKFKIENKLQRVALYPENFHSHASIIFIILAVESLVNGFFFSANVGYGMGALIALSFAFVNVSLAVAIGIFFRYKNSHDQLEKIFGWGLFIIGVVLLVGINSILSTYRALTEIAQSNNLDVVKSLFDDAVKEGLTIFTGEIPFNEMNGFLLFFIGIVSAGISIWKGYTALDSYPGYTTIDKQAKAALNIKNLFEKECSLLASNATNSEIQKREKGIKEINYYITTSNNFKTDYTQGVNKVNSKIIEISKDYKQIIISYRDAVKSVTPVDIPKYFHNDPEIELEINTFEVENTQDELDTLIKKINFLDQNYSALLNQQISDLNSAKNIVMTLISEYFSKAEIDAKKFLGDENQAINIR